MTEEPVEAAPEQPAGPPQPHLQFVVETLQEELAGANANRVYLMACLKQLQAEFRDAEAMWKMERASLMVGKQKPNESE